MTKQAFDAIIIGFGKGGKTLAGDMASRGLKVALVEKSPLMYGGTCINKACIPTKKLEHEASKVSTLNLQTWEEKETFYQAVIEAKETLISGLRAANYQKFNVYDTLTIFTGEASFINDKEVKVSQEEGELILEGKRIFINTGTVPFIPNIQGIKEAKHIYTSDEFLNLKKLPKTLTIIGAGFIGLEFASIYSAFGTKVTVIHTEESILPQEDEEDRVAILEHFNQKGVEFIHQARLNQFATSEEETVLHYEADGQLKTLISEAFLVATGRRAHTEGLGLDKAGVKLDSRGFIEVSDTLQTSTPSIWALGDVNGGPQFTYISLDDYRIIKDQLFGEQERLVSNRPVFPRVLFLDPAFSRVGLNIKEAQAKGYEVDVAKMPVAAIPRAKQLGKTKGFLKVIIDRKSKKVLGASLLAEESSEMIHLLQMTIDLGLSYTYLRDPIYAHPTMSEALNDLLGAQMIKSI